MSELNGTSLSVLREDGGDCHKTVKRAEVESQRGGKTFLSVQTLARPMLQGMKEKKL